MKRLLLTLSLVLSVGYADCNTQEKFAVDAKTSYNKNQSDTTKQISVILTEMRVYECRSKERYDAMQLLISDVYKKLSQKSSESSTSTKVQTTKVKTSDYIGTGY